MNFIIYVRVIHALTNYKYYRLILSTHALTSQGLVILNQFSNQ